jgi:cytoskeletal protein RodZ
MSDINNKRGDKMTQNNKPSSREWYKHGWGLVVAVLFFFPYFIVWYAWAKSKWSKNVKIAVTAVVAVIMLPIIIGIATADTSNQQNANTTKEQQNKDTSNQPSTPPEQKEVKPEPTENTSDLDLSVFPRVLSLGLKNNESGELKNCEVQINPGTFNTGYSTRVPVIGNEEVNIPYGQFTKKSEKFDSDKYAVENIVVTMCAGQTSRLGIYSTN